MRETRTQVVAEDKSAGGFEVMRSDPANNLINPDFCIINYCGEVIGKQPVSTPYYKITACLSQVLRKPS